MKNVLPITLILAAGLLVGCSTTTSRCETICERVNECSIDQNPFDLECPEYCDDVQQLHARVSAAGAASCEAAFEQHLDCWEQNSGEICNLEFRGCDAQRRAFSKCVSDYCLANPKDTKCTGDKPFQPLPMDAPPEAE